MDTQEQRRADRLAATAKGRLSDQMLAANAINVARQAEQAKQN
jgi:hypothetical protein